MSVRVQTLVLSYDHDMKAHICLFFSTLAPLACAQGWPTKPIRVIVSVPAGGTPDVVARMVTPGLSVMLGQQLVVDNRGGASGLIGAELAARAAPDGYTLFFSSAGALTILPHMRKNYPFETLRDFAPVSMVCIGPFLLITHPSVQAKTVKELIALAKTSPGKYNFASAGSGTPNHLAMELFKSMTGINITHVPYKGAPQAVTDVLGGNMHMMMNSIPPVIQHIRNGRLRLLGVSSAKRAAQLPDVPTISEAGVPGYEVSTWFGMLAPAQIPKDILARLHSTLAKVVHAPELKAQFEALGYDAVASTPSEFATYLRIEHEKYGKLVKLVGAKVE